MWTFCTAGPRPPRVKLCGAHRVHCGSAIVLKCIAIASRSLQYYLGFSFQREEWTLLNVRWVLFCELLLPSLNPGWKWDCERSTTYFQADYVLKKIAFQLQPKAAPQQCSCHHEYPWHGSVLSLKIIGMFRYHVFSFPVIDNITILYYVFWRASLCCSSTGPNK
jgi:hypothetical protein